MLEPKRTTWVLVCDGARARVLANRGRGTGLAPVGDLVHAQAKLQTHELGADRPGRSFDSAGQGRHAMEPPADWQRFEKREFAREMSTILNKAAVDGRFDRLVVVAPPEVLGDLRKLLDSHAGGRVTEEIPKDLTQVPLQDLGSHLGDSVPL